MRTMAIRQSFTCSCLLLLIAAAVVFGPSQRRSEAAIVQLTGITAFLSDSDRAFTQNTDRWNTLSGDALSNIWLTEGMPGGSVDGLTGDFINGPGDADVGVAIELTPGEHQFTLFLEDGTPIDHHGINLFFDGNVSNPGISVFAQDTTDINSIPAFFANSSASTLGLEPSTFLGTVVPGAGTLIYSNSDYSVTLTEFFFSSEGVFGTDRVDGFST